MVMTQLVGEVDDETLKEELETCRHFVVDSEVENGGHRVSNVAMDTLDEHILNQKLDIVFEKLKCAAKLNVAFGFVLQSVEVAICRYYSAHKSKTLMK